MKPFVFGAVFAAVHGAKSCTKPSVIPYGELRCGNTDGGDTTLMNDGDICLLACDEGTDIMGTSESIGRLTCNDGELKQTGYCNCPECCDLIPEIEGGTVECDNKEFPNKKKSKCSLKCDDGYEREGAKDVTCKKNNKEWSDPWGKCVLTVETTTEAVTTTEETTTTTTTTTTSTSTSTTAFETTKEQTTAHPVPDPSRVGLTTVVDGTDVTLSWKPQADATALKLLYIDQYGVKNTVDINPAETGYVLSGLRAGYRYQISLVVFEGDDAFSDTKEESIQSEANSGTQCIECHSEMGNEECNAKGLSCTARGDQVCQTVVRASNGLPARFEKRCKQKLACENERALFKSHGICGGGSRSRNVDVCVYCCEGDFCNAEGEFSDVV